MDSQPLSTTVRRVGTPVAGAQAVARASALLRGIAGSTTGSASLAELARALDLQRPTAHRILRCLVEEGLVQQDPATRCYELGPLLYELGLMARPPLTLHSLSHQALADIAHESGDTALAIISSGLDGVCLDRVEGSYPVKALMLEVGQRRPMGIGAGSLAMLSAMPEPTADAILDANAARIRVAGDSDVSTLKERVAAARKQSYTLNVPVGAPEILSLAVPVLNRYGTPIVALTVSALRFRIEHRLDHLVALLRASKATMEQQLRLPAVATDH